MHELLFAPEGVTARGITAYIGNRAWQRQCYVKLLLLHHLHTHGGVDVGTYQQSKISSIRQRAPLFLLEGIVIQSILSR